MNIRPQGTVYLLQHIPLRPDLNMTIYPWASKQAQFDWFYKHKLLTIDNVSRVRGNSIIVEVAEDEINYANYMMFKNTGFTNKWFYAFVTGFEYVNNTTTRIFYQLDLFQSWCFDWQIQPCFVDREHVNDDTIGVNTVPENLEHGPYICAGSSKAGLSSNISIGLLVSPEKSEEESVKGIFDGYIYSGGTIYTSKSADAVNAILTNYNKAGKLDAVASLYATATPATQSIGVSRPSYGFMPKNKKLFCYPYCYALLSNLNGQEGQFEFENFSSGSASFSLHYDIYNRPGDTYVAVPQGYKGEFGINNSVKISGLPQYGFSYDTYKQWLAQTANSRGATLRHILTTSTMQLEHAEIRAATDMTSDMFNTLAGGIANAINMGVGVGTGSSNASVVSSLASGLTSTLPLVTGALTRDMQRGVDLDLNRESIKNQAGVQTDALLAEKKDHAVGGCSMAGTVTGGGTLRSGTFDLACFSMRIKDEYALIIDDYFSMYGYAIHRIKYPNFTGRQNWNYVKTVGVVFKGYDIPLDMQMQLAADLDKGMTFWHNPDTVGDYTQTNAIVTE